MQMKIKNKIIIGDKNKLTIMNLRDLCKSHEFT